ncbi:MAG: twin-arginine translocase TatA/TatE family subunit [Gammaproteobacteria bacterium]|nr:twin-arginine translocase TatA/TatE family subunit [Gammaproteobacteria bacterium]
MGLGGISPVQLIIILVIVLLIFGTKKLKNFGGDLGGAIKGFKKAVKDEGGKSDKEEPSELSESTDETVANVSEKSASDEKKS